MKLTSGQIKNSSLVAGSTITDALNTLRTSSGSGTGDMVKTVYDTDNDGKVDVANLADSVPWTGVTDKPVTFTPTPHNHPVSEVTGLQSALDGKANSTHTHAISDVTGLQTALDSKQDVLVSGVNIKTINSESLLGSGNIIITGGGGGATATDIHAATSKTTPADADELGITDSAASWGLKKLTFANLKAWIGGLFVSKSGDTINGNLNFSGTGRRITGDFSNATVANRLLFQTNQPNTATVIGAIPSGSGTESRLTLINNSNATNASGLDFRALTAEMQIRASNHGAGPFLPLTFHAGGDERLRIDPTSGNIGAGTNTPKARLNVYSASIVGGLPLSTGSSADPNVGMRIGMSSVALDFGVLASGSVWLQARSIGDYSFRYDLHLNPSGGNVLVTGPGCLGYGPGAGGAVVQPTSKSTAVSLNKPSGKITMHNESLAGNSSVRFSMNNTFVTVDDEVSVWLINPVNPAAYDVAVDGVGAGVFDIRLRNITPTSYSSSVVIGFAVRKAATS